MLIWENVLKKRLEGGSPDPRRVEEATRNFLRYAAVLDQHLLDERRFLLGSQLTLADFSAAATLGYAEPAQIPWGGYSNLMRWYAGLETLDAWKKSAP